MSAERLKRIRPVIQKEIDNKQMPGAIVMVLRKGAVVFSDDIGVKHDAIFRAYSMTKPMVSVLAMMMVEEGQLQLADPVAKFLPALAKQTVLANPLDGSSSTVPAGRVVLATSDAAHHWMVTGRLTCQGLSPCRQRRPMWLRPNAGAPASRCGSIFWQGASFMLGSIRPSNTSTRAGDTPPPKVAAAASRASPLMAITSESGKATGSPDDALGHAHSASAAAHQSWIQAARRCWQDLLAKAGWC